MLDNCTILHKGGVVLWSRSFTPAAATLATSAASPVNTLIRDALIEGRDDQEKYERDGYAIKWSFVNDLELIFVVAYQRILQLTYVDDLLTAIKTLFVKLFQPFLVSFVASLHGGLPTTAISLQQDGWNFRNAFRGWDKVFDKVLHELESKAIQERKARSRQYGQVQASIQPTNSPPSEHGENTPTVDPNEPTDAEEIARNIAALKARTKRKGPAGGRGKGGKANMAGSGMSGSESDVHRKKQPAKNQRKWADSAPTEDDMATLDFSTDKPDTAAASIRPDKSILESLVDVSALGTKKNGLYEVKDWEFLKSGGGDGDDSDDDIISKALNTAAAQDNAAANAQSSFLGGLFSRLTGSRVLTKADLAPVLAGMKQHLMTKNVAREIAEKVCEGVGNSLEGKKVGGFKSIKSEVRIALSDSITRILTPKTSTDMLLSIRTKHSQALPDPSQKRVPYSITFVGVNGVGKSTNLSKVCFWLLQNDFRVLIAACDTFRSGAVEQLRVHVRNLSMLVEQGSVGARAGVELYERGYGKDAAGIAKDAIAYGKENNFDVVLIDTAGRMQDNEPLMRALAKLVATNNPDKIVFVGEALVGNEAVDQLTKFDRALKDFSSASTGTGVGRGIDGMLVTKWDTVDDKVGAALSMTYVTGQPILFVGCGQTYTDLRQLRVAHVVQALLSD